MTENFYTSVRTQQSPPAGEEGEEGGPRDPGTPTLRNQVHSREAPALRHAGLHSMEITRRTALQRGSQ